MGECRGVGSCCFHQGGEVVESAVSSSRFIVEASTTV